MVVPEPLAHKAQLDQTVDLDLQVLPDVQVLPDHKVLTVSLLNKAEPERLVPKGQLVVLGHRVLQAPQE
jgi:hypothetical protein